MMLMNGENEIYMFDRDHNVYQVPKMRFIHRKENRPLKGTLVDGVRRLKIYIFFCVKNLDAVCFV